MINFKSETMSIIDKGIKLGKIAEIWEVDELLIYTGGCDTMYYKQTGGQIDWDAMAEALGRNGENPDGDDPWDYDDGYGIETFCGWITFKGSISWMVRETYDGSEWWSIFSKPSLSEWKNSIHKWDEERDEN